MIYVALYPKNHIIKGRLKVLHKKKKLMAGLENRFDCEPC